MRFTDRAEAGRKLAGELTRLRGGDLVVLGLPRGGIPVAFEVAHALGAPLDVIVVRKLGLPYQPQLAMGAIGPGGVRVLNTAVVRAARVSAEELRAIEDAERAELRRQVARLRQRERPRWAARFRLGAPELSLRDKTALIIDDGVTTGATARAACEVARAQGAARVAFAVPVGKPHAVAGLRSAADDVVCLETPEWFIAIDTWYALFDQVTDGQVVDLLRQARPRVPQPQPQHRTATATASQAAEAR